MIRATDIRSLTEFTRNAKRYVQRVRETGNPLAITVNGDAAVVVQDAESFQRMMDELEHARSLNPIREGKRGEDKELSRLFKDWESALDRIDQVAKELPDYPARTFTTDDFYPDQD